MHHSINRTVEFFSGRFFTGRLFNEQFPSPRNSLVAGQARPDESAATLAAANHSLLQLCDAVERLEEANQQGEPEAEFLAAASADSGEESELRSLSALLPQSRFFSGTDIEFRSVAESAEKCTPGQLVVYRLGIDCPEELICQAMARGAAGILTEQILPAPLPQCICCDTDRALAEMKARELIDEHGSRPDQRLLTIGVVGESGKSTTALCLATILRDIPCRVAYETDLGHSDGVTTQVSDTANCKGAELVVRLSEAADAGAAVSILELDAATLRCGGYDQIGLDVLVITGKNSARRDFGPSPIECALERVVCDGVVIVSGQDPTSLRVVEASGLAYLTYGVDVQADVAINTIGIQDGVLTALIRNESRSAIVESFLGQGFFAESMIAAAAVGIATDNPLVQIAESLSKLRELPGRCQAIQVDDWNVAQASPKMLLDVGGSPQRAKRVLTAVREQMDLDTPQCFPIDRKIDRKIHARKSRRPQLWCVLAVSPLDDSETLALYGRLLETMPDHCVLTCDRQAKEQFLALSHGVLDGVEDIAAMRLVADQERAISWATRLASAEDTIVVLGGIDRRTPQQQRTHLLRLQRLMEQLQQDAAAETKIAKGQPVATTTPALKIFNPDA